MNIYDVRFHSDLQYGQRVFAAKTPQNALRQAKRFARKNWFDLDMEFLEPRFHPINEILVDDEDGNELAVWTGDNLLLQRAAPDLLAAAELVVARCERGDLAGAVRELSAAIARAKEGTA